MFQTGGHTTLLSPDAAQTAIDAYIREEFDRERQPAYLSCRNDMFFKQSTTDHYVYVWDEESNVGAFQVTNEQEEILHTSVRIGNTKTKRISKYTKSVPISWEAFRADVHDYRARIGQNIGDRARLTQDKTAILETYGDAFAGSINKTPDGQALASNSHTTITGATVDNLETGQLNADNLWVIVTSLANQQAQDGEAGSQMFSGLVVPFLLYKTAKETLGSSLVPFSGENQLNIFDTDYGQVAIKASVFLGSAYNSNSNANTSYHAVSQNHQITRMVFSEMATTLIPPESTPNDTYVERARYAEASYPASWTGYVGSNGTT